ncbi:hypothetical protein AFLA70_213g001540 [Aspergillus flavus AF70]|nr:hypothetical protein AFLA70_213g001540 [Aspergillus flavus AF70]
MAPSHPPPPFAPIQLRRRRRVVGTIGDVETFRAIPSGFSFNGTPSSATSMRSLIGDIRSHCCRRAPKILYGAASFLVVPIPGRSRNMTGPPE